MTAPHPPATDPVPGPEDVVSRIDTAVDQAREDVCACGCGNALTRDGASFYFYAEGCQRSWRAQQNAIAAGDHELAERLRRQQRETPAEREARHRAEVLAEEAGRQERAAVYLGVAAWLRANGINPDDVLRGHPIVTTPTRVRVHEFIREPGGRIIVRPDEIPFAEREYRLLVPWPAGLRYDDHHHEPDPEGTPAGEEEQPVQPRIPVALAVAAMGYNEPRDAVALDDDHPLVFRVLCRDCGRRSAPYGETIRAFGEAQPVRGIRVCEHCGAHSPGLPFKAIVTRDFVRRALVLHLEAGRHNARFVLAETEMDHYPTAAGIWDVLAKLVQRKEQQEWQGPDGATPALTVVDELAELPEPPADIPGRVMVAPVGTPPDGPGWQDLGTTTGDGLVLGFDGATRDDDRVPSLQTYHAQTVSIDFSVSDFSVRHQQHVDRWRRTWERIFGQVTHAVQQLGEAFDGLTAQYRSELLQPNDVMRRAIEAKKNRNTGPTPKRRAPRRIDPRRGR